MDIPVKFGRIKPLAILALLLAPPLLAACTPDTPETALSWDVNDRPATYHQTYAARPTPHASTTARTYVYEGDDSSRNAPVYTMPAPKPRPAYRPASTPASSYSYGDAVYTTPGTTGGSFEWPVSGRVISQFGATTNGERNDGINIAAALDTPIRAAASGTVTYSGNELKDYGNLLLIKHDNGYVTAYAHADRLLVGRGDFVAKGQVIGYAGSTGDVSSPQLHFEIRQGTTPVNPQNLLMARNS